jgi:hypothetical protein
VGTKENLEFCNKMAIIKKKKIKNAGENVVKRVPLCTIGGNVN